MSIGSFASKLLSTTRVAAAVMRSNIRISTGNARNETMWFCDREALQLSLDRCAELEKSTGKRQTYVLYINEHVRNRDQSKFHVMDASTIDWKPKANSDAPRQDAPAKAAF